MTDFVLPQTDLQRSLRSHLRAGIGLSVVLLIAVLGWSARAQLAGAVVTHGQLVVESSAKKIQHPTGGVVSAIRVHDGERVAAGQILVELDATQPRANLAVVSQSLDELRGRRARLEAERDGAQAIKFPLALIDSGRVNDEVAKIIAGEQTLFDARLTARTGQKSQLSQRIDQLRQDIIGLTAQQDSKTREIELVKNELEGIEQLYAKKLVPMSRVSSLRREAARLDGERGALISNIAESKGKVAEIELQVIQVDQDLRTDVLREMRDVDSKIEEMTQREVSAKDQLARIEIRSPQEGIVNSLSIHTVGGVVAPARR